MQRTAPFRRRLRVLLASIVLIMLSAAGAAASQAGFVYALRTDGGASQIFGYSLDPLTGALAPLPGFPMLSGGDSFHQLVDQIAYGNGRLHVFNGASGTMSVFTVNRSTGALTALPFSPVSIGPPGFFACLAVHPSGSPVVIGDVNGHLASFVVTPTTATAAPGSPFVTNSGNFSCAFSRDGNFVYAGGIGNFIAGLSVNPGTGVLTPLAGSPFNSGGNFPRAYATDGMGRLFSAGGSQVLAFTTADGVPTGVSGNSFPSGLITATHGVHHPSGFYVVADGPGNQVGVYQISGSGAMTTLSAVSGSPFAAHGEFTNILALTSDGLLVVANGNSRNLEVFQVNGTTGNLTSLFVQVPNTLSTSGFLTGLAFAPAIIPNDFNGDARGDFLWRNTVTGQNIGWLMNGLAVSNSAFLSTMADTNWAVRGRGDFSGDGKNDIVWRNTATGESIAWLMNGLVVQTAAFLPTLPEMHWELRGVGDVNADGNADLLWRHNVTGENRGWLMNGTTVAFSFDLPFIADTNWEINGLGDFNSNAKWDVIWRNRATGENIVWLMNGTVLETAAFLPTIANTNWEIVAIADVSADGNADVFWRHKVTGQNIGWLMNGTAVAVAAFLPTIADTHWEIKGIGDMNADRMADVIWRNKATGQNIGWQMNGLTVSIASFFPTISDTNWGIVGR